MDVVVAKSHALVHVLSATMGLELAVAAVVRRPRSVLQKVQNVGGSVRPTMLYATAHRSSY